MELIREPEVVLARIRSKKPCLAVFYWDGYITGLILDLKSPNPNRTVGFIRSRFAISLVRAK